MKKLLQFIVLFILILFASGIDSITDYMLRVHPIMLAVILIPLALIDIKLLRDMLREYK